MEEDHAEKRRPSRGLKFARPPGGEGEGKDHFEGRPKGITLKRTKTGLEAKLGFLLPFCTYSVKINADPIVEHFPKSKSVHISYKNAEYTSTPSTMMAPSCLKEDQTSSSSSSSSSSRPPLSSTAPAVSLDSSYPTICVEINVDDLMLCRRSAQMMMLMMMMMMFFPKYMFCFI